MNIILMSNATSRARVLTLDWRHGMLGAFGLMAMVVGCALIFNFITLKYAATSQNPFLQAILLADQREEAAGSQEIVQGHLNAMAIRLGELQAQCCASTDWASVSPRPPASNRRNCRRCNR